MRIGVIGYGSIGERHVENILSTYPHATVDVLTKRKDISQNIKNVTFFASKVAFFKQEHDVFFITNETHKHANTILECLKYHPKGIFIEKPLSHTSQDISRIRKAIKKHKTVFFVAYCLQFFKPLQELKRVIDSGTIGNVFAMRVMAGKDVRTWRKRDYTKTYSSKSKGGGVMLDLIHEMNYPGWLLGEKLHFLNGAYGRIMLPTGPEDIAQSNYKTARGIVVSIHQDYLQSPGMRMCEVFGDRGTAIWSRTLRRGSEENQLDINFPENGQSKKITAGGNDMYLAELKFFMEHIHKGSSYSNFEEAVQDMKNVDLFKKNGIRIAKIKR